MNTSEVFKKWSAIASYVLHSYYGDCNFCHKLFRTDKCPKDSLFKNYDQQMEILIHVIRYITDRLYANEIEKLPFDISYDDIIEILEDQDGLHD